jgi:pyruvate formate lyase activating enzyme
MISGQEYTPQELCREAAKDAAFYRRGGGGVTVSGGEVMLQWEVVAETLRLCRGQNLNTCMETSGYGPWEHLWAMAQYCHTVFFDLKHIDGDTHRALTGVRNEGILQNLRRLCEELPKRGGKVIVRMPLVPGYNDDEGSVAAAAEFVASLPHAPELNLLPYHDLGQSKYEMIGEDYPLSQVASLPKKDPHIQALYQICRDHAPGNRVSLGGDAIDLDKWSQP